MGRTQEGEALDAGQGASILLAPQGGERQAGSPACDLEHRLLEQVPPKALRHQHKALLLHMLLLLLLAPQQLHTLLSCCLASLLGAAQL
jgi:hypothetical protein